MGNTGSQFAAHWGQFALEILLFKIHCYMMLAVSSIVSKLLFILLFLTEVGIRGV